MAGKPLTRNIISHVTEQGGADWLYEQIASGVTVSQIAKQFECARGTMSRVLNSNPEWAKALEKGRLEAADAIAERGLELVDGLSATSGTNEIAAIREQANYRKFMAGALNAERYGGKTASHITINLGDLHIEALKKSKMIDITPEVSDE